MITINMMLLPGGSGFGRSDILTGSIWTTDCGNYHAYNLWNGDNQYIGKVPKVMSGHRNPFHLLSSISDHILDNLLDNRAYKLDDTND